MPEIPAEIVEERAKMIWNRSYYSSRTVPEGVTNWDRQLSEIQEARRQVVRRDIQSIWDVAYRAGREDAARKIAEMPYQLGDEGWKWLEGKASEAGWAVEWVSRRRRRDDFTTATIESAYQYGYRRAAEVARGEDPEGREDQPAAETSLIFRGDLDVTTVLEALVSARHRGGDLGQAAAGLLQRHPAWMGSDGSYRPAGPGQVEEQPNG